MGSRRFIVESDRGLEMVIHVQPRAHRTECAGLHGSALKLRIAAPPVADAANRALLEFIAERLGIARARVRILVGEKSRTKKIALKGMGLAEFVSKVPGADHFNG